jgi:molybdopterin-dependent oxidoreductase alpha subunit
MAKESFKPYTAPAAGWGALKSVAQSCLREGSPVPQIRALLKTNQDQGFDCPGCAWGEKPGHDQAFKFCENGAKAVNWEASRRRVDASFFAQHSVTELRAQSDHWLEAQGRLTEPMRYNAATDHYEPIDWDSAFGLIAKHLKALPSPDQAAFYTSGRASNEAAFLYQLMVRAYGTNNLPDCSNMCHEASGVALKESIGVGKGTVTLDDFEKADALFVIGQNPGTNHPRMLEVLRDAVARGAEVVVINPLKERGLEKFQHPQSPTEMLGNRAKPTHTRYLRPRLGGDMAIMRGIAKTLFAWDEEADRNEASDLANHEHPAILDRLFLQSETTGLAAYRAIVEATEWQEITLQSGLTREEIEDLARVYTHANATIFCWAMGITQHQHSVAMIQEFTNVLLLRGQIGKPGAGVCPVRGHSNVQGDRTMGIHERPPAALLDALRQTFSFQPPRHQGFNTVETITAMEEGRLQVFVGLGGNFAQATPDQTRTHAALQRCALTVQISTKLNRSHLVIGHEALILPCLGRTDQDLQASGPQSVTVEDSFSMVHASCGVLPPLSPAMRSEPAIVAGIAYALLGNRPVEWLSLIQDYGRIRDLIARTIPGFDDFNRRLQSPGGFYLGNTARARSWATNSGKAQFMGHRLPAFLSEASVPSAARADDPVLTLQSIRSHDQYNTSVYSLNDRYRGVSGQRDVVFLNPQDMQALGIREDDRIDLVSVWADGRERRLHDFKALPFDIPRGQAAAYYPEVNTLIALESHGDRSFTPTSKFIPVRLRRPGQK